MWALSLRAEVDPTHANFGCICGAEEGSVLKDDLRKMGRPMRGGGGEDLVALRRMIDTFNGWGATLRH